MTPRKKAQFRKLLDAYRTAVLSDVWVFDSEPERTLNARNALLLFVDVELLEARKRARAGVRREEAKR